MITKGLKWKDEHIIIVMICFDKTIKPFINSFINLQIN